MARIEQWRRMSVGVEAIQINEDADLDDVWNDCAVRKNTNNGDVLQVFDRFQNLWVDFKYGDHIVRGAHGEYYPIVQEIFDATHRKIDTWNIAEEILVEMDRQSITTGGYPEVPPTFEMEWGNMFVQEILESADTKSERQIIQEVVRVAAQLAFWANTLVPEYHDQT